jgi:hypothetical protein
MMKYLVVDWASWHEVHEIMVARQPDLIAQDKQSTLV